LPGSIEPADQSLLIQIPLIQIPLIQIKVAGRLFAALQRNRSADSELTYGCG
jgi:hypothetical protein